MGGAREATQLRQGWQTPIDGGKSGTALEPEMATRLAGSVRSAAESGRRGCSAGTLGGRTVAGSVTRVKSPDDPVTAPGFTRIIFHHVNTIIYPIFTHFDATVRHARAAPHLPSTRLACCHPPHLPPVLLLAQRVRYSRVPY